MNIRELVDALGELYLVRGENIPMLSEEGLELVNVEFNDDDEPCVLMLFEEER